MLSRNKKDFGIVSEEEVLKLQRKPFIRRIVRKLNKKFFQVEEDDKKSSEHLALLNTLWFMKTKKDSELKAKPEVLFFRFFRNELITQTEMKCALKRNSKNKVLQLTPNTRIEEKTIHFVDIEDVLSKLKPSDCYLMLEYYIKERTMDDIGNELCCSKENIRQKLNKAKIAFMEMWNA